MADIFAIAAAGLRANMAQLDAVSHNVANINTQGYKRELHVDSAFDGHLRKDELAAASMQAQTTRDWSAGALRHTGAALNFAIEGEGWFQLRSPHGILLTRDGSFQLDRQGQLVSVQGWPVILDSDASFDSAAPTLNAGNELWSGDTRIARFEIVQAEPSSLQPAGANLFGSARTTRLDPATISVRQGFLEGSNVNSLQEMVQLIQSMRQAEASQRVIRAYDEALETAITTMGEF